MSEFGSEHYHKFLIPVEWVEMTQNLTRRPYGYKVTKLMCECGATSAPTHTKLTDMKGSE